MLNQNLDNDLFLIDSLKLQLGYEYNLNDVKEIQVTDSFLTLDESEKKCQNTETYKVKLFLWHKDWFLDFNGGRAILD